MSQDPRFRPQLIHGPEESMFQIDVNNLWVRLQDYHTGRLKHIRWGAIASIEREWNYEVGLATDDSIQSYHATFVTISTGRMFAVKELPAEVFQKFRDEINKITGLDNDASVFE